MMTRGMQLAGELSKSQMELIKRLSEPTSTFSSSSMQVNQSVVKSLANHGFAMKADPLIRDSFVFKLTEKGRTVWEFLHQKPDPNVQAAERYATQKILEVVGVSPEPVAFEGGDDREFRTSYRPMCLRLCEGAVVQAAIDIRFNTTLTDLTKLPEIVDKLRELQEVLDRE